MAHLIRKLRILSIGLLSSVLLAGDARGGTLSGDLGEAPADGDTITRLEIRNSLPNAREGEIAFSGIPIPRELGLLDTQGLAVVTLEGRRLAAQFDVLSRWGGTVDDQQRPIRWLQVSLPAAVPASGQAEYLLRRIPALPPAQDPMAAMISVQEDRYLVDTGLATFTLKPEIPGLFEEIQISLDKEGQGRTSIYSHVPGDGPRLIFAGQRLDSATEGLVSVDADGFEIVERGPVKVVVSQRGHFHFPGGASLCNLKGSSYERFGYSVVATFLRASRDIYLQFHFRNECSDAFTEPWTDQAATIDRVSWGFSLNTEGAVRYFAGSGPMTASSEVPFRVEQLDGGGTPWRRRAQVLAGGAVEESGEYFESPLAAFSDARFAAAAQIAWMRFREPQALETDHGLVFDVIGGRLFIGEGKGIWNFAKLSLFPIAGISQPEVLERLEAARRKGFAELEHGLLVRTPLDYFNSTRIFPSIGTETPSAIKTAYLEVMQELHDQTVRPDGQWERAKTFGSQLWPDVQADLFLIDNDSPEENSGAMNYWNPSGAELMEFLRSGDPRWVWEFALPQSRLQMFTAYLNIGDHDQGNRAGFAVTSGGAGEGQWHRSAFGSDDYSYNLGMQTAYVLRPDPLMRRRFAQAGRTAVNRYGITEEAEREQFVSQVNITRQVIQHFEMLANCAEFVPGQQGLDCRQRLVEVVTELARDNLRPGVMCQGDVPSTQCPQPQQFMQAALMAHFFQRYLRNYGDVEEEAASSGDRERGVTTKVTKGELKGELTGLIGRALVNGPLVYSQFGIPKQPDGTTPDINAGWAALLDCTLDAQRTEVTNCVRVANSDGEDLLNPNKPHSLALMLMAHELDPSIQLCQAARNAYQDPGLPNTWLDYLGNDSGWWKGNAQMMQGMVFGIGIADTCSDLPLSNRLYFAQFADGSGLSSQILLFDPQGLPVRAEVELRSGQGGPLGVDLDSRFVSGKTTIHIPAQGLVLLQTDGLGTLQNGTVSVASDRPLSGAVVFGGTTGLAGVGGSLRLEDGFLAPLTQDQSQGIQTGLAVMNLEENALQASAEIFRSDGTLLAQAALDPIPAQGSRAIFLAELLPQEDLSSFDGLLRMTADGAMAATVLQTRTNQLSTLPVTPVGAGSAELFFAQFADGQGISSQILLYAADPGQGSADVQLELRDSGGSPLSVVLNGQAVEGQLNIEVPALGIVVLQSSGEGALRTGNVSVASNRPIAGVIIFGSSQGRAGVGSSLPLTNGFVAPMQSDATLGIRTGVALMNLEGQAVTVSLQLFDRSGAEVGAASQDLPPGGSLPRFLDELFPGLELSAFQGLLHATSTGRIAATVLQTRPAQFATLPVAPL